MSVDDDGEVPSLRRFAIVPTNGRSCLNRCLQALVDQVDVTVVVWTSSAVPNTDDVVWSMPGVHVLFDLEQPKNISRWWNLGLDYVDTMISPDAGWWHTAVINDDVIIPPGWFATLAETITRHDLAAACSGGREYSLRIHTKPFDGNIFTRLQGFAFMLAGEKQLRVDEELVWWCGDNDLDHKARKAGGMGMVPGFHVEHLYPNGQMTPDLQVQAGKDCALFAAKWGFPAF